MNKHIVAQQMIDMHKWCIYNRIEIMGGKVRALGYTCRADVVATQDINIIADAMEAVCAE